MFRLLPLLLLVILFSCHSSRNEDVRPNVILIMADDMGYECLGSYGGLSYPTPHLDSLAAHGLRISHCISQPLCTPSRVKIMTGQSNLDNYEAFGYLGDREHTIGHLMEEAGYATGIVGKWQLNGLAYKDRFPNWQDSLRPQSFGFQESCLWQLTHLRREGERYAFPLIQENGEVLNRKKVHYGPDVFADFAVDFIDRHAHEPFFLYYPMVLVHDPFVPTPTSQNWDDKSLRYQKDISYFREMVSYTDQIVGQIIEELKRQDLFDNTILIFTGDNGTHPSITSQTTHGPVKGGKGCMTDAGTRVPLIISWPVHLTNETVWEGLISFADFYPTLAELVQAASDAQGMSFLPLLQNKDFQGRKSLMVHYDPRWSESVNQYRGTFIRNLQYKCYADGRFYDLEQDVLEEQPIDPLKLNAEQEAIFRTFQEGFSQLKHSPNRVTSPN
ncbi:MAG: sulfatase-like hydrolase/transferase [Bacteroidota bacterium]